MFDTKCFEKGTNIRKKYCMDQSFDSNQKNHFVGFLQIQANNEDAPNHE